MTKLLIIAAGGTGGHLFPAQALAEEMLSEGWRVVLSTDVRGARYAGGFPDAVERRVLEAGTFAGRSLLGKIAAPFRIGAGVIAAVLQMSRERPAVVVGFGGYPAFPAMAAAWILRVPRMIHEQNGVLGRVNRIFARRVDRVACSVWPTDLPTGSTAVHTGNPVRARVRDVAGAEYPQGDPLLLVFGGSQGATILSRVVPTAVALLPADLRSRLRVVQQAREGDLSAVVDAYAKIGVPEETTPFIDDMPARLAAAHLVIARSGASSVADIACVGRPAIYVPLAAAIRDEQSANARPMVEADAAVVLQEPAFTSETLAAEITAILTDPTRAKAMAEAAKQQGRPDAVLALKSEVLSVAGAS